MEAKRPRSITNMVFVVVLAVTLLGAADFAYRLIKYAIDGSLS
jgi:hypothetical protein